MKKINLLAPAILFLSGMSSLPSCIKQISGQGEIITEIRPVGVFEEVECNNAADVEIFQDSVFTVEVSDYENIVGFIETNLEGDRLVITTASNKSIGKSEAKVIIRTPHPLRVVKLSGSGNFYLKGAFNDLAGLEINGSGDIIGEQPSAVGNLSANNRGSGNISFKGTANTLALDLSGSGDIDFTGTQAQDADCQNSGSGNIFLTVSNTLNAVLTGSGNIEYYGNPAVTQSDSGSGEIIHH